MCVGPIPIKMLLWLGVDYRGTVYTDSVGITCSDLVYLLELAKACPGETVSAVIFIKDTQYDAR